MCTAAFGIIGRVRRTRPGRSISSKRRRTNSYSVRRSKRAVGGTSIGSTQRHRWTQRLSGSISKLQSCED